MDEYVTKAKKILDKEGIITWHMIKEKLGIPDSSAVWIIKKMLREKIVMEGEGYGIYVPFKNENIDTIINKMKDQEVFEYQVKVLKILNDAGRSVRPKEIYSHPSIQKSKSWFTLFIAKLLNYGLVEKLSKERGLYKITEKGKKLLKILEKGG